MAAVATVNATAICPHAGTVTLSAVTSTLTVGGADVIIVTDVIGATITGCTWAPPPPANAPCLLVGAYVSGLSTTLKKGGVFVLLTGAKFLTNGTPGPFQLTITETQIKLTAA